MSRRSSTGSSRRGKAARAAGRSRAESGSRRAHGARVLHLDCFSGIAGNMFLGALLDLGLSRRQLDEDLAGLDLPHRLVVRRVRRGPLAARWVDVLPGVERRARARTRAHAHAHDHGHHERDHERDHRHDRDHHHGRHYREVERILVKARLDARVRERALAIFEALGRAEAHVHGIPLARVHFHEVGAIDAIVDVTGAAIGIARLDIARVTASEVALGSGTVDSEHGVLPLPAPATLELLRGVPTVPAHVAWETVTPTGAAILRTLVESYGALPAMTIEAIGHGAGNDRKGALPNVLRAVLGRAGGATADRVACLETNLDDLVPEHFDHLMERLFEAGALDVSVQHVQMKKNRPGFLLRVLASPATRMPVARILFSESTALGVRAFEVERIVLERELRRVVTPFGRIGVKVSWDTDGAARVSAEYDDCKRAARRAGVPLREVVRAAEEAGRSSL